MVREEKLEKFGLAEERIIKRPGKKKSTFLTHAHLSTTIPQGL